jgi:hypothetical protein
MNALARIVHNLVTSEQTSRLDVPSNLSHLELEALADLRPLLNRPPQELAALLAREQWPEPWLSPPPDPRN